VKETLGLDVGTSRLVLARRADGNSYRYDSQLNAFIAIPYSKMTESALRKESIPAALENGHLIVHGNESARFADLLRTETRRPMTRGFLNSAEPESASRLKHLIRTLLGNASRGQVYFTVPAPPLGQEEGLTYHESTVRQILEELGFTATPINEGLAVVYAELESTNYSGIGISCGGGLVNVCLAYLSMPVVSFSIPKAGDFIDQSAASVTGEIPTRVRLAKEENFYFNGSTPDKLLQVLTVYYDDMIRSIVGALKETFSEAHNIPKIGKAIPLVLAGGSTMPRGFRDRFERTLRESDFPLALSEIRLAESPLFSSAKGALVAALADSEEPLASAAGA
jgi:hypothetical protein